MSCFKDDNTVCTCFTRGDYYDYDHFVEVQKKINVLTATIKRLQVGTDFYDRIMKQIKILRGDWFIDSPDHNFCFFKYMEDHEGHKHTLRSCSELLHLSMSVVANSEKKGITKLKDSKLNKFKPE